MTPEPLLEPQEEPLRTTSTSLRSRPASEAATLFDEFWKSYPRKVGKDAARKEWAAAVKRATAADIILALQRQVWPSEERFIPHPTTWLRGGRWQDDPKAAAPSTKTPGKLDWMDDIISGRVQAPWSRPIRGDLTWAVDELRGGPAPDAWTGTTIDMPAASEP